MSYASFIRKWTHPEYPPKSVDASRLLRVEEMLQISLPRVFEETLITHGAASATIDLLDAIVDQGLPVPDVQDFLTADQIIETTKQWRGLGLPNDAVAIATDCMGNLFCFRLGGEAVWLWDHDLDMEQVAADFPSWMGLYCAIDGGEP